MSMQFIRAWLEAKPHRAKGLMDLNESYVYFQVLDGPALGSLGRPLTPGRSLAIDKRMWSLGYPFWVEIEGTATEEAPWSQERMRRPMVAQDPGGAIRGQVRGGDRTRVGGGKRVAERGELGGGRVTKKK